MPLAPVLMKLNWATGPSAVLAVVKKARFFISTVSRLGLR